MVTSAASDSRDRATDFPLGAAITLDQLELEPYGVLAELRANEPVSWLPALDGWFVTSRELGLEAMRDADTFTVDDPRFTTATVLGPSMLSVDGNEHSRHREPFTAAFRPSVIRDDFTGFLRDEASRLVDNFRNAGRCELRTGLAGPLAVGAITEFLGLVDVTTAEILAWHTSIAQAIVDLTVGGDIDNAGRDAIQELQRSVANTLNDARDDALLRVVLEDGQLDHTEITSGAAVLMFGAIETAEGMTANALWHLLTHPTALERLYNDRQLVPSLVEESLRLEPAAAFIDRYATRTAVLGGVTIAERELVTISLLACNRDPAFFVSPDSLVLDRVNGRQHLTFAQGPHACIGVHLARLETITALNVVLDRLPGMALDREKSTRPYGLIFRKPDRVWATWDPAL